MANNAFQSTAFQKTPLAFQGHITRSNSRAGIPASAAHGGRLRLGSYARVGSITSTLARSRYVPRWFTVVTQRVSRSAQRAGKRQIVKFLNWARDVDDGTDT